MCSADRVVHCQTSAVTCSPHPACPANERRHPEELVVRLSLHLLDSAAIVTMPWYPRTRYAEEENVSPKVATENRHGAGDCCLRALSGADRCQPSRTAVRGAGADPPDTAN